MAMDSAVGGKPGPSLSSKARKGISCERQDGNSPESQLGDFSRVFDFLSTTSETACVNHTTLFVEGSSGEKPLDAPKSKPDPISKVVTKHHGKTQSTISRKMSLTNDVSSGIVLVSSAREPASGKDGPGVAAISLPLKTNTCHVSDSTTRLLPSAVVRLQLDALKTQLLNAKLRSELDVDSKIQAKYFDERPTTHIFIDMSNIYIGFNDSFKAVRGIPQHTRTPRAPLDFKQLSKVLERGRTIGAREVVGSAANPENISDLPQHFHDANCLSYETSILRRVLKPIKASRGAPSPSSADSGGLSSSSESGEYYGLSRSEMSYREQGVDEILQLKMGNTAMAHLKKPGIMVLATGDAETAEYSDGFQKQVERILKMGWVVEVVSWKRGLSHAWRRSRWAQKWGDQFRIILLDPYVEDLKAA